MTSLPEKDQQGEVSVSGKKFEVIPINFLLTEYNFRKSKEALRGMGALY